jgi:hypothetical protein
MREWRKKEVGDDRLCRRRSRGEIGGGGGGAEGGAEGGGFMQSKSNKRGER